MQEFDTLVPDRVSELKDYLVQFLPENESDPFSAQVLNATDPNADFTGLSDRLGVRRLREECLSTADRWPAAVKDQVTESIQGVIDALEGEGDRKLAVQRARAMSDSFLETAIPRNDAERAAYAANSVAAFATGEKPVDVSISADSVTFLSSAVTRMSYADYHSKPQAIKASVQEAFSPGSSINREIADASSEAVDSAYRREAKRFIEELKSSPR